MLILVPPYAGRRHISVIVLTVRGRTAGNSSDFALLSLFVAKIGSANRHYVARAQKMLGDALGINVDAVAAAPVDDPCGLPLSNDHCVPSADEIGLQLDVILARTADCHSILEQRKAQFLVVDAAYQEAADTIPITFSRDVKIFRLSVINVLDDVFDLAD